VSYSLQWNISDKLVAYPEAVREMEARVAEMVAGREVQGLVWLLEHLPVYTAGTSARLGDLLDQGRFPVYESGRGGKHTYHGPGQRVAYVMVNLRALEMDVHQYVRALEEWIILTLSSCVPP